MIFTGTLFKFYINKKHWTTKRVNQKVHRVKRVLNELQIMYRFIFDTKVHFIFHHKPNIRSMI